MGVKMIKEGKDHQGRALFIYVLATSRCPACGTYDGKRKNQIQPNLFSVVRFSFPGEDMHSHIQGVETNRKPIRPDTNCASGL